MLSILHAIKEGNMSQSFDLDQTLTFDEKFKLPAKEVSLLTYNSVPNYFLKGPHIAHTVALFK